MPRRCQAFTQLRVIDQALYLAAQQYRVSKWHDEGRLVIKRKIPAAAGRADDGKTTGHGLGGRVGPTGAPLGDDEQIGPGKEPGHPVLGKVEIKFVGDGSPDERPGIMPFFPD